MEEVLTAEVIEEETAIVAVSFEPATITADWDGIVAKVRHMVEPYDGVTPESLAKVETKDCKKFRADLNSISKELNDARKAIKKAYERPLKEFEARCKEVDEMILGPCSVIDGVIKKRETEEREAKRTELEAHFFEFCEDNGFSMLLQNVSFDRVLKKEWLNKTYQLKKAFDEIDDKVSEIMSSFNTLMNHYLFDRDGAIIRFFDTLSIVDALEYDARRQDEQNRLEALKEQQAQVNQYREPAQPIMQEAQQVAQEPAIDWEVYLGNGTQVITVTRNELYAIRDACQSMGLELHARKAAANE